MYLNQLKDKLVSTYAEVAEQLKKGNPNALYALQSVLRSSVEFSDDAEIIFQQSTFCGISLGWLEAQARVENGKKFLKTIGDIVEKVGKAYSSGDNDTTDKLLKEFLVKMHLRWKEARLLQVAEEE